MNRSLPLLRLAATLLSALGFCLQGPAALADDKLFLKSGDVFEGAILEDTPAGVKIQVRSGTIRETKSFPRDQIDRIERPKPDDIALKGIQAMLPTPSLLDTAGYQQRIAAVERFLRDFPDSAHRPVVQKILGELKVENDKVATGALKVNGEWISATDRKAHQENIDAEILLSKIVQMGRSGAYLQALRELENLRTKFPKTRAYANSVPVASDLMKAYGRSLTQAREDRKAYDAAYAERKARLTEAEVRAVENEAAQRQAQIESLNERERTAGIKWRTVNLESVDSITDAIAFVRKELTALEKVKVEDLKLDAEALYEAETLIAQGQLGAAEIKLREAMRTKSKLLTSRDPHIGRVIQDLKLAGEGQVKAAKLAELEKAKQEAASKPVVTVPAETKPGDVSAEDVLGDVMAVRPGAKAGDSGKAPEPASKEKASAKTKTSSRTSQAAGADEEPAGPKPRRPAPAQKSGGVSFPVIMGAVLAVLLGVTVAIYFLDKKKKAGSGGSEE